MHLHNQQVPIEFVHWNVSHVQTRATKNQILERDSPREPPSSSNQAWLHMLLRALCLEQDALWTQPAEKSGRMRKNACQVICKAVNLFQ